MVKKYTGREINETTENCRETTPAEKHRTQEFTAPNDTAWDFKKNKKNIILKHCLTKETQSTLTYHDISLHIREEKL